MRIIAKLLSMFVFVAFALGVAQPVWADDDDDDSSNGGNGGKGVTVEHWDKIVFSVRCLKVAGYPDDCTVVKATGAPANTPLDIKVKQDPSEVTDLVYEVCKFLGLPNTPASRKPITIISVAYAIVVTKGDDHGKSDDNSD